MTEPKETMPCTYCDGVMERCGREWRCKNSECGFNFVPVAKTQLDRVEEIISLRIQELKKLTTPDNRNSGQYCIYLALLGENQAVWAQIQLIKEGKL